MKKNQFIDIGGAPYSRWAQYKGFKVWIAGYDANTERHLIIRNLSGEESRIELDNDKLLLREKHQRTYS